MGPPTSFPPGVNGLFPKEILRPLGVPLEGGQLSFSKTLKVSHSLGPVDSTPAWAHGLFAPQFQADTGTSPFPASIMPGPVLETSVLPGECTTQTSCPRECV